MQMASGTLSGHRDRIVRLMTSALAVFAELYDEPGHRRAVRDCLRCTPARLTSVLSKLAAIRRRLADLERYDYSSHRQCGTRRCSRRTARSARRHDD